MGAILQTSGISSLDLNHYTDKIKDSVDRISKEFYFIGFYLWEINHFKAYKNNGFDNIYDYAAAELKFNKSSVYNFIGIINKFAEFQGGYPRFGSTKKFEEYNYSQMCEMLSLSDENINKIKPDMTIKEIRSIKKELKVVVPKEVIVPDPEAVVPKEVIVLDLEVVSPEVVAPLEEVVGPGSIKLNLEKLLFIYNRNIEFDPSEFNESRYKVIWLEDLLKDLETDYFEYLRS